MANISIERIQPDDWQRFRAVRLRALADSPEAFGTTLAQDEARPSGEWRTRLENPEVAQLLAVDADGNDVGIVVGGPWKDLEATAALVAMWVAPEARGTGVGGALVDAIIAWARDSGYERVNLDVANHNTAAIALYESRNFLPTGNTGTLPPPRDHIPEHERTCVIARIPKS